MSDRLKELPVRTTQSLSITLPVEMAEMVKAKVASGEHASESEVIRDGLRTLIARIFNRGRDVGFNEDDLDL